MCSPSQCAWRPDVGWCIHHKISHWLGEWNVLECSSLEPCAMENESIHQMSHIELNWIGLNVGKESFPSKKNCVLLSWERIVNDWWHISHRCPLPWWWGGGGKDHQTPWPASWGPFSWFRKLHEISTGSSSRIQLNSRGQFGAYSEWIPDLWHPLS